MNQRNWPGLWWLLFATLNSSDNQGWGLQVLSEQLRQNTPEALFSHLDLLKTSVGTAHNRSDTGFKSFRRVTIHSLRPNNNSNNSVSSEDHLQNETEMMWGQDVGAMRKTKLLGATMDSKHHTYFQQVWVATSRTQEVIFTSGRMQGGKLFQVNATKPFDPFLKFNCWEAYQWLVCDCTWK